MSWIVQWNGKDYDVDPTEFTGMELKLVKERTGLSYSGLIRGLKEQDGDAICALFWIAARRENQSLNYGDFEGPPLRLVLANLHGLLAAMEELGKLMEATAATRTTGTAGIPSSPSGSLDVSTEPSMTG